MYHERIAMENLTEMPAVETSVPPSRWRRARRLTGTVIQFFLGEGALQAINLLAGLYLIRVLSVESYAQFALALSVQLTVGILMDLGFASTIIPLVGDRGGDRLLVGRYVRAAKHLRDRAFRILAPVAAILFLAVIHRHHWSLLVQAMLLVSILLAIYSSGKLAYFSAPLFLYGRLKQFYLPQTFAGAGRLLLLWLLRVCGMLSGWAAALANALNITLSSRLVEREAHHHIKWPAQDDSSTDREILHYILPVIPATVFAAYQGQSAVFLIGLFGQTAAVAQVAALGRLAQLFSILSIFNAVVVEPAMARQPREKVGSRYALIAGFGLLLCAPVVAFAFVYPGPILWLLGSKYVELRPVIGWAMLTGAINYFSLLLWVMNRSRKWIFWSGTMVEIALILTLQAMFLALHGVHTTSDAIFFALTTSLGPLATHIYVMLRGFFFSDGAGRTLSPSPAYRP